MCVHGHKSVERPGLPKQFVLLQFLEEKKAIASSKADSRYSVFIFPLGSLIP